MNKLQLAFHNAGHQSCVIVFSPYGTCRSLVALFIFCGPLQEHPVFRRKGADLVIEKNLTLIESLCGFDFSITHMDKRTLRVKSNPGQVMKLFCSRAGQIIIKA